MFKNRFPNSRPKAHVRRSIDKRFSVTRDLVSYESLLVQDLGNGSCRYLSDVDLLFNQERLDRMSLQSLQQKLNEQVRYGDKGLSELRKNIKDEDLHKFIKSRYIQSLSELRSWSGYLAEQYGDTVTGIRNYLASLQKPASDSQKSASDSNASNGSDAAAE